MFILFIRVLFTFFIYFYWMFIMFIIIFIAIMTINRIFDILHWLIVSFDQISLVCLFCHDSSWIQIIRKEKCTQLTGFHRNINIHYHPLWENYVTSIFYKLHCTRVWKLKSTFYSEIMSSVLKNHKTYFLDCSNVVFKMYINLKSLPSDSILINKTWVN